MEDPEPNNENIDGQEREGSDNELDGADDADGGGKQEYVKKEYFARPYVSPYGTENVVKAYTVKNSR